MNEERRYWANGLVELLAAQGRQHVWLARQIGISKSHMSRVLSGERSLSESQAQRVADILQIPLFFAFQLTDVSVSITREEQAA